MKKIAYLFFLLSLTLLSKAQVPQRMTYQAVVRNANNELIVNQPIGIRISVLCASEYGQSVYVETHSVSTNSNGLFSLQIGGGEVVIGNIDTINWGDNVYFLKNEVDPAGGNNYSITTTQQLLSVPYALYAKTADNVLNLPETIATKSYVDSLIGALLFRIDSLHNIIIPQGGLNGTFSVSSTKVVRFSKGCLQYKTAGSHMTAEGDSSQGIWRFAEHQYDIIDSISNTNHNSWFDAFCWGTSGYNNMNPAMTSENNGDYPNEVTSIANTYYDWGVYNAISNGGNTPNMWRTPSAEEWDYLINTRPGATAKKGFATIDTVIGLVILPDNWSQPTNTTFVPVSANDAYTANVYSITQWELMEENGAVFLPLGEGYASLTSTSASGPFYRPLWIVNNSIHIGSGASYVLWKYNRSRIRLIRDIE